MKKYTTIDPNKLAAALDLLQKNNLHPGVPERKLLDTIFKDNDESQRTNPAVACISVLAGYFERRRMSEVVAQTVTVIARKKITAPRMTLIPMSPTEYSGGGAKLIINYNYASTAFGQILIASTDKGVCYATFIDDDKLRTLEELKQFLPQARYKKCTDEFQRCALLAFTGNHSSAIYLHLKGTSFQLAVWNKLVKVPPGGLITYSLLMGDKRKSRATGTAVANNPVAYLVPCHRVIRSAGTFNQYRWGSSRKTALLAWEAALADNKKIKNHKKQNHFC